ncbi:hypothetical protein [Ktedonobacter racemifer]|nr:hypothetical protein [Ktedonobacter racemifer]
MRVTSPASQKFRRDLSPTRAGLLLVTQGIALKHLFSRLSGRAGKVP